MNKYHINNKGIPGECSAQNGNCPFAPADEHFDSLESAQTMSDFKSLAETDLNKALDYYSYENLSNKELRVYRRIVLNELNKEHNQLENNQIPISEALSKEELESLYDKARKEIIEENKDYLNEIQNAKKNFDFRPWKNGVPRGLISNISNKKIAKLFCENYFVNESGQIDVNNFANLQNRMQNEVMTSRYAQNFKEAVAVYKREADKNIEQYKMATMDLESLSKDFYEPKIKERFEILKNNAKPTVDLRRINNSEIKESNSNRKEILTKLNREMAIRNNFSKYEKNEPKIIKRINSVDLPSSGDYDLKINPKTKNNEIDNIYLMGDDNKLYKVVGFSYGEKVDVVDYAGFRKSLTTRNSQKRADLHSNYTFLEIEKDENLDSWKGLKTIHFEENN